MDNDVKTKKERSFVMELFATLLCMFSMFGGIFFILALIIRKIRKKPKSKWYFRGLLISILVFIASIVLFAVFQTPESKAKYEQQRIEAQKEKEAQEKAKEEKAQAKAEQKVKEQAEQEAKEKAEKQAKQEAKEKAKEKEKQEKVSQKKKSEAQKTKESQDTTKEEVKPSTEEILKKAVVKVVGKENLETFNYVPDNNFALIKFKGSEDGLTSKLIVKGMYMDISNVLKGIQKDIDVNVDINVTYPLQDKYGNVSEDIVIQATFNNETIKKINFDNFDYNNIPSVADEWWNHNALNITD